jgi:hypothetical protein
MSWQDENMKQTPILLAAALLLGLAPQATTAPVIRLGYAFEYHGMSIETLHSSGINHDPESGLTTSTAFAGDKGFVILTLHAPSSDGSMAVEVSQNGTGGRWLTQKIILHPDGTLEYDRGNPEIQEPEVDLLRFFTPGFLPSPLAPDARWQRGGTRSGETDLADYHLRGLDSTGAAIIEFTRNLQSGIFHLNVRGKLKFDLQRFLPLAAHLRYATSGSSSSEVGTLDLTYLPGAK